MLLCSGEIGHFITYVLVLALIAATIAPMAASVPYQTTPSTRVMPTNECSAEDTATHTKGPAYIHEINPSYYRATSLLMATLIKIGCFDFVIY